MDEILKLQVGVDINKKQQCQHLVFDENICAVKTCRKHITKCDSPVTVCPFRYIDPNLSLTPDAINRLREIDFQNLIKRKKLRLVLDLDNTLIHSGNNNNQKTKKNNKKNKSANDDDVYEILKGETLVKLRPGARDFLSKVSQLFELSIFTMADKPYAREIEKILESDKVRFSSVVSREDCSKMYRKSLDVVLSHQRVVLIVDDLDEIWVDEDRGNIVKIKPYTFFPKAVDDDDDQELARVFSVLKAVHSKFFAKTQEKYSHANVRQLLKTCN